MPEGRQYNFRFPPEIGDAFERAAAEAHMSLTAWLMQAGLLLAGESAFAKQLERAKEQLKPTRRARAGSKPAR